MANAQRPIAPEPIVRAALRVLHVAGYTTRNWTDAARRPAMAPAGDPSERVFDLWESLHPVPETLLNWTPGAEQRLLSYFDGYNAKWPEPRLRHVFDAALREASVFQWPASWHPIDGGTPDDEVVRELRREAGDRHVLHGVAVRPIGRRHDRDDVLFELLDGSGRLALVHLTYARDAEADPRWPATTMFGDWQQFERQMQDDSAAAAADP